MVAIYARQSLDKKDSLSIEGQIELCQKYAGEEARVFQDKGFSGKNTDRPELKKMMNYVREGDTVIVESISRFARNTKDLLELVEKLTAKQVEFVSKKENIDLMLEKRHTPRPKRHPPLRSIPLLSLHRNIPSFQYIIDNLFRKRRNIRTVKYIRRNKAIFRTNMERH